MKAFKRIREAFDRFAAGHGFALLTALCVAVITATALWTRSAPAPQPSATPPVGDNQQAAALWQQTLPASTPTPLPTAQPLLWQSPLAEVRVLQPFSADEMVQSGVTGVWAVHQAVDLAAEAGAPVAAMAPGRVLSCGTDDVDGTWIALEHTGGYVSRYAGLSLLGAFQPGDPVSAGQTIGFAGSTAIGETDLGPHLHLSVTLDGQSVDPLLLLP